MPENSVLKTTMVRLRRGRKAKSLIEKHGPQAIRLLDGRCGAELLVGAPGDIADLLDRLTRIDRRHRDETSSYKSALAERDEAHDKLRDAVVGLRRIAVSAFGEGSHVGLGFARQTPEAPALLAEYVTHLLTRLNRPKDELPEPLSAWTPFAREETSLELASRLKRLTRAEAELEWRARAREATKVARDQMLSEFDHELRYIVAAARSLFYRVGLVGYAQRLYLRRRKKAAQGAGSAGKSRSAVPPGERSGGGSRGGLTRDGRARGES